jgi:transposase
MLALARISHLPDFMGEAIVAAPCTRFIADLTDDDREFLLKTWRTHDRHSVRCRAHAILLSAQEVSVPQLTMIFNIDDDTARSWLSRWEQGGREGLEDAPRPGGPFKVDDAGRKLAIDLLHEHPNSPNTVIDKLEKQTGKTISRRTLNRWARKAGMRWKRFKKSLKKLRSQEQFDFVRRELAELASMPHVKLAYFDEATFSLSAVVPYGWQDIGTRQTIDLSGERKSVHVLAIEETDSVNSYMHRGSISGKTVVEVLNDYATGVQETTVLVLDNASPHTCKLVREKQPEWERQGLILYPLPPYSPELNQIEHTWKHVKYSELPAAAWRNLGTLVDNLTKAFAKLGRFVLMPSLASG